MRALWHGTVIAESDDTVVEGNHYFPADAIKSEHFELSSTTTDCPWKGTVSYCTLVVEGARSEDAAWCYPGINNARQERRGPCRHLAGRSGPLEPS
jgi:uncharacterized protein (DUF427 family)